MDVEREGLIRALKVNMTRNQDERTLVLVDGEWSTSETTNAVRKKRKERGNRKKKVVDLPLQLSLEVFVTRRCFFRASVQRYRGD